MYHNNLDFNKDENTERIIINITVKIKRRIDVININDIIDDSIACIEGYLKQ